MTPLMKFHHDYYAYQDKCRKRRENIGIIIAGILLVAIFVAIIVWGVHE